MCIETVFNYKDKRGEDLFNTKNYAVVQNKQFASFFITVKLSDGRYRAYNFPHLKMTEIKAYMIFIQLESHHNNS